MSSALRTFFAWLAAVWMLSYGAPGFGQASFPQGPNPNAVSTFHSIGLYWHGVGGASVVAQVEFKEAGTSTWRRGHDLWYDSRNSEYRGSIVELKSATTYDIKLTLQGTSTTTTFQKATWSENFPIATTITVKPGTTHFVVNASDSGTAAGYTLVTGGVIDQNGVAGNAETDSCVVVRQGAHHVIIRGLELKNCKRYGVYIQNQNLAAQTHDIVIEDNRISGWSMNPANSSYQQDGAVHCTYWRQPGTETEAQRNLRPDRVIIQRNTIFNPRFGANPWQRGQDRQGPLVHPNGPQGVTLQMCGKNHVIRYNDIYSENGNHYMDGLGGPEENHTVRGFPWADSDIYGNRISEVYDDGIEAEGANRNVRIWGNYLDRVMVAIGNASNAIGPLYVWRNVSNRQGGMYNPDIPDSENRGGFVKGGSPDASTNGGRAYYYHNTALQPPPLAGLQFPMGAGNGIRVVFQYSLHNFVSRNNIWHIHKVDYNTPDIWRFFSIDATCGQSFCDSNFDLYNGRVVNAGPTTRTNGESWRDPSTPLYDATGTSYPGTSGDFSLAPGSPGFGAAPLIFNFNDQYASRDIGAHQSGTPPMQFGVAASAPVGPTAQLAATPTSGAAPLTVSFNAGASTPGSAAITSYSINFGDGTSGSGAQQNHAYAAAGTYTATLTVTDAAGRTSADVETIQVGAPVGGGGGGGGASAFRLFLSAGPGLIISRATNEHIDFAVSAADGRALQQVRFFLDGALKATDTTAPFQYTWVAASTDAVGNHLLLVEAVDSAGNVARETRPVTLLQDACGVFVTAASVNQGQPLQVQGICSTWETVNRMEFFVDGVIHSRDVTSPYTWTIDTSAFPLGIRSVRVRGMLAEGRQANASVNVELLAAPLTVTLSPGAVVRRGEAVTIAVTATDGRPLGQVDFFVNGSFRSGENMAPFTYTWQGSDGLGQPDGSGRHLLQVQATDNEGNLLVASRHLYALAQTCNAVIGTSRYVVGNHDKVYTGPHRLVQGQPFTVHGLCSATQEVQQVEFYVDGMLQTTDVIAPWGMAIDTGSLAIGGHTLSITARMKDGGVASDSVPIEIVAP